MKKILALALALLMLLPAMIACKKDPNPPAAGTTDPAATTAPDETLDPNDRKNAKDNLPADFNMNGQTVGVLTRHSYRKIDWDGGDSADSDVLAQAVFNRTAAVEARLGLTFELTDMDLGYDDYGLAIEENVMAGDDTWQIILAAGNASIRLGNDHLFQDVSNLKYLDFDQPWWANNIMDNMSIDGESIRYLAGDAIMNTYFWANVAYFNKRIYEENFGNPDDLYQKAINKDWTYDDLHEMVEAAANDVDGDGLMDDGDVFGMFCDNSGLYGTMEQCASFKQMTRNEDGYPVIEHDIARGTEVLDIMYDLCWNNPGFGTDWAMYQNHPDATSGVFTDGNVLFAMYTLSYTDLDNFRNMEDDYGILPIPLIDEKQEEYRSTVTTSATFLTIPKTCGNADDISGVIEALSSESYRNVVEVFYESALKMKYSRDSYSGQCIDIIKDSLYKDFMMEYGGQVGCNSILRTCIIEKTKAYASLYNAQVTAANKRIIDLVDGILAASEE